jgi:glucan phosphoethanolaminetransferase (alkaline phosphatase superfamily)
MPAVASDQAIAPAIEGSTPPPGALSSSRGVLSLCVFSVLLLSPAVAALFLSDASGDALGSQLALSLVLWSFWVALWGKPYRACLAAMPFLLTIPVADYLLFTYRSPLNPQVVAIILETNTEESLQYLGRLWPVIVLAYASVIALAGGLLRVMRQHPVQWAPRWRVAALVGAPAIVCGLHFLYQPLESAASGLQARSGPFRTTPWPLELESLRLTAPFGFLLQVSDGLAAERKVAAVHRLTEKFRFGAHQSMQSADRQVFVLVIGESSREDKWSLNGYTRRTSPRLQREANLVSFDNVITVAPWTLASVPVILTRKPAEKALDLVFPERSLVSAFREAGFATYWMSTQTPVGAFDAAYSVYAKEAEHVRYFNLTGAWQETPPDGVMLAPLEQALAVAGEDRQLIVIHTLGSHAQYRRRYPNDFDVFKPTADKINSAMWHDQAYRARLNNTYDNTILYTDYFLSEVIAAVKASGRPLATVLYVADHGEDLYDGGCENSEHGHVTFAGVRIPMFFWYSDAYQQRFPDKVMALKEHREDPLTNESIFPLMLDAAQIRFPGDNPALSVMGASFVPPSRRLVRSLEGKTIDFDHAHPDASCLLVN